MNNEQSVSPWVKRYAALFPTGSTILDLACGSGRHTRFIRGLGYQVVAVDKDTSQLQELTADEGIDARQLNLETENWPLQDRFGGIVVTNYLHRPHLSKLADNLTPDGVLIYATFAVGNEQYGRPRNPDFLLRPGELKAVFGNQLHIVAYEEHTDTTPVIAVRQRICAVGQAHPAAS